MCIKIRIQWTNTTQTVLYSNNFPIIQIMQDLLINNIDIYTLHTIV